MLSSSPSPAHAATQPDAAPIEVRPRLRGVLHAATAPIALVAGLALTAQATTGRERIACGVFTFTVTLLFATSAAYHTGCWSRSVTEALRRLDHANIFLAIAGSYTPLAVLLLPVPAARDLLGVVWGSAAAGIGFKLLWPSAPRRLSAPLYLAAGWTIVFFVPEFIDSSRPGALALMLSGGLFYTAGGIVYALKRPDPAPTCFGFHEVFHALTVAGFLSHAIAVALAMP